MAGKDNQAEPVVAPNLELVAAPFASAPQANAMTLDEFCTRLSGTDNRVELTGAFHHVETINGRYKDTETAYRARFDAFATAPV